MPLRLPELEELEHSFLCLKIGQEVLPLAKESPEVSYDFFQVGVKLGVGNRRIPCVNCSATRGGTCCLHTAVRFGWCGGGLWMATLHSVFCMQTHKCAQIHMGEERAYLAYDCRLSFQGCRGGNLGHYLYHTQRQEQRDMNAPMLPACLF